MSAGPTGLPGQPVAVTTLLRALGAAGPIERLPEAGELAALRGEIARLLAERHETNERPHDAVYDEQPIPPVVAARAARSAGRLREFVARSRAGRAGDSRG